MFLNSFSYFRAIAIILIVITHSYGFFAINTESFYSKFILNLITGGTSLFVFISGFLFNHVFYDNFNYFKFISNKIKNVLLPYILLSSVPIIFYISMGKDTFGDYYLLDSSNSFFSYIIVYFRYLSTGVVFNAYWYIPFVIVLFFLSPIHHMFTKAKFQFQILIILLMSIISIFIHRPIGNLDIFQSLMYFTPVYFLGITVSKNKELFYRFLSGKEVYIFTGMVLLSGIQAYTGHVGNYHKSAFDFVGVDIMYLQKIFMCFFLLIWLRKFENKDSKLMFLIANTSFAIYFLHPFILWVISRTLGAIKLPGGFIGLLLFTFFVITLSILIALFVKFILKKRSRIVLGY